MRNLLKDLYVMKGTLTLFFLIIAIIAANITFAQNGHWQWAVTAGDGGVAQAKETVIDNNGDIYAIGNFEGAIQFGSTTLASKGKKDVWIAKYSNSGIPLWATSIGSTLDDEGNGITTDQNGNIYITGTYKNTLFITSTDSLDYTYNPDNYPYEDAYLIKLDNRGGLEWEKQLGGIYEEHTGGVKTDNFGNVYVAGVFGAGSSADTVFAYFGNDTLKAYKGSNAYIAKYDTSGNIVWAKSIGEEGNDETITSIDLDSVGNIYAAGSFEYVMYIDHLILYSEFVGDITGDLYIAKFDSAGTAKWATNISGQKTTPGMSPGTIWETNISVASDGSVAIAGYYERCDIVFVENGTKLKEMGGKDVFMAKYYHNGKLLWANSIGYLLDEMAAAITTDKDDNIYIAGTFYPSGHTIIAGDTLMSDKKGWDEDIYIAKYDKNGNGLWAATAGGYERDYPNCINTDKDGAVYVTGGIASTGAKFGNHSISAGNSDNMFLAKYIGYPTSAKVIKDAGVNISTYPNPFTDQLTISGISQGQHILITDMYGRAVYNKAANGNICTLQLGHIPPGVYHLSITGNNGVQLLHKSINKL